MYTINSKIKQSNTVFVYYQIILPACVPFPQHLHIHSFHDNNNLTSILMALAIDEDTNDTSTQKMKLGNKVAYD